MTTRKELEENVLQGDYCADCLKPSSECGKAFFKEMEALDVGAEKICVIDTIFGERDAIDEAAINVSRCKDTIENVKDELSKLVIWALLREGRDEEYIKKFLSGEDAAREREVIAEHILYMVTQRITKKRDRKK